MDEKAYRLVEVGSQRADQFWSVAQWAFGEPPVAGEAESLRRSVDWSRSRGVEVVGGAEAGRLVAASTSWRFDLPAPGARIPAGGLTWVGVHPGHRRQGLLSAMIERHLADCQDRGEPISVLTATEAPIYPRFGYGLAASGLELTLPRGARLVDLPAAAGVTVELVEADVTRWSDQVESIHRAAGQGPWARPGWVHCATVGMAEEHFDDFPERRGQAETLKLALAYRQGRPSGYAFFQRTGKWVHHRAVGSAAVKELVALDPASGHALWSRLLDLDLTDQVTSPLLPVDDPLLTWLVDPRAAQPLLSDVAWLRLVDLPTALSTRRYATAVDLTLEVTDRLIPANAGRWRLVGGPDQASLTRTEAAPDLVLDVKELGSLYLGGGSTGALAGASRIEQRRLGALAQLDAACHHWLAPGLSRVF
ncbi:MAG: GNAT family N-acetyltransferase [Propionibacteriaceae bacterium]|nr:GNAT family N-acetyltransferase [Propionibacteriaceae bacterium]